MTRRPANMIHASTAARPLRRREFLALGAGAGLALAAGRLAAAPEPAELILANGRIATLDLARPRAEALAIRGGRVLAVGSNAELMALRGPATQVIELGGRTAIPGLV